MFDVPVESTYLWIGLALVSALALGLALRIPTAPPPDATAVARTVDSVASSPYGATARQPLEAAEIRLGSERVGLRGSGGSAHAAYAYDPVVPATGDDDLRSVLFGRSPRRVFDDRSAFERALDGATTSDASWQPAPSRLTVRRATWGETNVTLVGA